MYIKFTVYGKPVPKGRPKFSSRGGFARAYTPKKTKDYEDKIVEAFLSTCNGKDYKEYTGAIKLDLKVVLAPPSSMSNKKRKELFEKPVLKKPDIDNYLKIVLDALNQIAFKDDNQVYCTICEKIYKDVDEEYMEVELFYE